MASTILVIGAGVSGLTTGVVLAERGLRTCRSHATSPTGGRVRRCRHDRTDFARWLLAHANAGTVDGRRILDADSIGLTQRPPTDIDSPYGMGWMTAMSGEHATLEHTGVFASVNAGQVLLPETGHGNVLLANANHAFSDIPRIKHGLVALLTGASPPSTPVTHRRLATLVGCCCSSGWRCALAGSGGGAAGPSDVCTGRRGCVGSAWCGCSRRRCCSRACQR